MNEYKTKMNEAIVYRLSSNEWDKEISKKVIEKYRKKRRNNGLILNIAATIIILLTVTIFVRNRERNQNIDIYNFVMSQANGIYSSVFIDDSKNKSTAIAENENLILTNDYIDNQIENTIYMAMIER